MREFFEQAKRYPKSFFGTGVGMSIAGSVLCFTKFGFIGFLFMIVGCFMMIVAAAFLLKSGHKGTSKRARSNVETNTKFDKHEHIIREQVMLNCHKMLVFESPVHHGTNIERILSNYESFEEAYNAQKLLESRINIISEPPSKKYDYLIESKAELLTDSVQRCYEDMLIKAKTLKTPTGRKNRQLKFFETLNLHMVEFPDETKEYIRKLMSTTINDDI